MVGTSKPHDGYDEDTGHSGPTTQFNDKVVPTIYVMSIGRGSQQQRIYTTVDVKEHMYA